MKLIVKRILSHVPGPLPVGLTEMNRFIDEVYELSGAFADRDSMAFAICSMIMHAGESRSRLPKNYFVRRLRKVAANQVAGQVFTDIKERQRAAQLEAQKQQEATASELAANEQEKV